MGINGKDQRCERKRPGQNIHDCETPFGTSESGCLSFMLFFSIAQPAGFGYVGADSSAIVFFKR
jgi:hypothetical protein